MLTRVDNARVVDCLQRIEELDPPLHAFQLVRAEKALREVGALKGRRPTRRRPLLGVPIAVKDNVDVAGEPTRHGSAATPDTPAAQDDVLVARLRSAGAIIVGKTTQPELAIYPFTESEAFGITRNPWNPEHTPGGSSGGSAAAVAAGMVSMALASDGAGSIRIPAACCGVFGIKPTNGLVPTPNGRPHWYGLSSWGAIGATVAEAALLLDVLAGTDEFRDPRPPTGPLRLAVSFRSPAVGTRLDHEVKEAVEVCAATLQQAGHRLSLSDPPYPRTTEAISRRYLAGIAEDAYQLPFRRLERRTRGIARAGRLWNRIRPVSEADAVGWKKSLARWFEDYDALLLPSLARAAPRVEEWKGKSWPRTLLDVATRLTPFTPYWNLAGLPAASVPAGLSRAGLPLGLQVVAPKGEEKTILALAAQLQELRSWPRAPATPQQGSSPFAATTAPRLENTLTD